MMISKVKTFLKDFSRREDGNLTMETMIVLPVMFWAFLVCFSLFDTFRMYSINQKAAFVIGDSISRETAPIDREYLDGAHEMFQYLSSSTDRSSLRISSLRWDSGQDRFYADWSETSGNRGSLTDGEVSGMTDDLPVMRDNQRIILVETWSEYEPPFKTGLEQQNIRNFVFTSPRFASRVCWEACPDGV